MIKVRDKINQGKVKEVEAIVKVKEEEQIKAMVKVKEKINQSNDQSERKN